MKSLPLLMIALLLVILGCDDKSDESNDSMDNNFTIIKGTVPGTLIQALCDENRLYSTNSIDNGTTQHPFNLQIPKYSTCSLEMITNEDRPKESVTVSLLFVANDINSTTLYTTEDSIDLGYIDLPMSRSDIVDNDSNGIADNPFIVEVPQTVIAPSSSSKSTQIQVVVSTSSTPSLSSSASSLSKMANSSSSVLVSSAISSQSSTFSSSSLTSSSLSLSSSPSSISSSLSSSSVAIVYEEYNASKIYEAGDRVLYEGIVFEAKWWVQGETPTDEAGSGAWKRITPYESYPQYSIDQIYDVGDRVYYNGLLYEAKWWTKGDIPSESTADGPWKKVLE